MDDYWMSFTTHMTTIAEAGISVEEAFRNLGRVFAAAESSWCSATYETVPAKPTPPVPALPTNTLRKLLIRD